MLGMRRLQFSLALLLVLMLVISLTLALLAARRENAVLRREIEELKRHHASELSAARPHGRSGGVSAEKRI